MLQIKADLALMNEAQREALAGFVLAYPTNDGTVFEYNGFENFNARRPMSEVEAPEISPADAFGPVFNATAGPVSNLGPPPSAPAPPPPSGEAGADTSAPVGNAQIGNSLVTLDKSGLPWDARIHATGKTFTNDGKWRKKRGVSDVLAFEVEKELRALMAIPSPPLAPGAEAVQPAGSVSTTVASPSVPPPPPPSGQAPPPPPPSNVVAIDEAEARRLYVTLIGRTSAAIAAGKLTEEQLLKCLNAMGIASLSLLGNRLDLVPAVLAMTDGIIAGQNA